MTTPPIPLLSVVPALAPAPVSALPGDASAFAALFGLGLGAAGDDGSDRQAEADGGNALPEAAAGAGEIAQVVPPALLSWLLAAIPAAAPSVASAQPRLSPTDGAAVPGLTTPIVSRLTVAQPTLADQAELSLPIAATTPMLDVTPSPVVSTPALPPTDAPAAMRNAATTPRAALPATLQAAETPTAVASPDSAPTLVAASTNGSPAPPSPDAVASLRPLVDQPALPADPTPRSVAIRVARPSQPTSPPADRATLPSAPTAALAPAARVFAAAIHRLVVQPAGAEDMARDPATPSLLPAPGTITPVAVPVTARGDSALDMGDRHWPEAMIARIIALRDASDALAASASIDRDRATVRLSPDALGTVEVALHRDEGQVRVQLTAEQPRTQALLAEAQPRLTELAEARGIRVVHAGTAAAGGDAGTAPQQRQPTAPPPAATLQNRTADDTVNASDHRIA